MEGREAFGLVDDELKAELPAYHPYVCPQNSPVRERHLTRVPRSQTGGASLLVLPKGTQCGKMRL